MRCFYFMATAIVLAGAIEPVAAARAEELFSPDYHGLSWGMKGETVSSPECLTVITIDQPTFSTQLPDMIKNQIFSDRVGPEMMNVAPHYLLNVLEVVTAPLVVVLTFSKNNAAETCHFQYKYINPDTYGNDKVYNMVSFDMTREVMNKVNWNRFNGNNLIKIASHFRADPAYSKAVQSESLAAILYLRGG